MTKLPEETIKHKGINYIATPDPENTKAGRICRELCDLRNTSKCGTLKCASKSIHWKKEKVKSSSTPKYKIKDGGFTLDDWLKAESCRDNHFINDFRLMMRIMDNNIFNVVNSVKELPRHFNSCSTMKKKFIEFGFVVEVKEEKFYSIADKFKLPDPTNNDTYVLAWVPIDNMNNKVFLCNTDAGTYRNEGVLVKDTTGQHITQAELDKIYTGLIKIN